MSINWKNYNSKYSYDEYLTPEKTLRKEAKVISKILNSYSIKDLEKIEQNCQSTISSRGINFKVYSADKKAAEEKKWPLDIIPRIILKSQWLKVRKGIKSRFSMIFTHSTLSYSPKWKPVIGYMHNSIVNCTSSKRIGF